MNDFDRRDPGSLIESTETPEQIEHQIERTRERLAMDLDELGDRLSPQQLKERAQTAVQERARRAGRGLVELIRSNPLPAIGAGLLGIWLFGRRRRSRRSERRIAREIVRRSRRRLGAR